MRARPSGSTGSTSPPRAVALFRSEQVESWSASLVGRRRERPGDKWRYARKAAMLAIIRPSLAAKIFGHVRGDSRLMRPRQRAAQLARTDIALRIDAPDSGPVAMKQDVPVPQRQWASRGKRVRDVPKRPARLRLLALPGGSELHLDPFLVGALLHLGEPPQRVLVGGRGGRAEQASGPQPAHHHHVYLGRV